MIEKRCGKCGTYLSDFYKTGMLGCPHCYATFRSEILRVAEKVQGATSHVGKAPEVRGVDKDLVDEYNALLSEKEQAGIDGRFSEMAELSKDILEIAEELKKRGLL